MSRENKLALVLGFGLILFVGILISDHFSVASHQRAADMGRITDPLVRTRQADAELIDYQAPIHQDQGSAASSRPQTTPAYQPARLPTNAREYTASRQGTPTAPQARDEQPRRLTMGEPAHQLVGLPAHQAQALPFTPHHVKSGETLSSICRDYYGDSSLADDLARFNKIDDPGRIRKGHRLRLPPVDQLVRGIAATGSGSDTATSQVGPLPAVAPPARTSYRSYTIKAGDSLSTIAKDQLGTARRYHELFELNRDVLDSPDDLVVGTTIKIPRH